MLEVWYWIIVTCRLIRLVLDVAEYFAYLKPLPNSTRHLSANCNPYTVTILIPTLGTDPRLADTVQSWLNAGAGAIKIVTVSSAASRLRQSLHTLPQEKIQLLSIPKPSHRTQLVEGIRNVSTDFIFITNDRSRCSPRALHHLTAQFTDRAVGGVTLPCVTIPTSGATLNTWESFGALNQVRRTILHSALAYFHHGQVLNLAGAASGYRTKILKDEKFYNFFLNETWLGKYKVTTADDNAMTRWTVQHGWRTAFPNTKEAAVFSGVMPTSDYLRQVKRWSRDTARSYLKDIHFAIRSGLQRYYVHAALNIIANYATDAAVIVEIIFLMVRPMFLALVSSASSRDDQSLSAFYLFLEHLLVASALTIFEHLPFFTASRRLFYIPGAIAYMYVHAFIVLYSCMTLHKINWDSRPELRGNISD